MAQQQPGRSRPQEGGGQVRGLTLPPIRNLVSNIPPTYRAQRGLPPMIPREPGNSRPHNEPETHPVYNFVPQPPPPLPPPQPGMPGAVHPHHLPPFNGHSPLGAIRHHQEAPLVHHRHHPYSPAMMVGFDFAHGQPPRTPGPWSAPAYISGPPVMGPPIPGYPHGLPPPPPVDYAAYHQHDFVFGRRNRRTQACKYCNKKKVRCEGGNGDKGAPCDMCVRLDIRCEWGERRKRGPKPRTDDKPAHVPVPFIHPANIPQGDARGGHSVAALSASAYADRRAVEASGSRDADTAGSPSAATEKSTGAAGGSSSQATRQQSAKGIMEPPGRLAIQGLGAEDHSRHNGEADGSKLEHDPVYLNSEPRQIAKTDSMNSRTEHTPSSTGGISTSDFIAPSVDNLMQQVNSSKVDADTREAVMAYFDYFYAFSPTLHPSTFLRRLVDGEVDQLLIDAIKAMTARFITAKTGRKIDPTPYIDNVKRNMIMHIEEPSLDIIRAIQIIAMNEACVGHFMSYNTLMCTVASMIVRLGWHEMDLYRTLKPKTWEGWVEAETKRRVFWLVYQSDYYLALMSGRPAMIPENMVYVRAPCADSEWDEFNFSLVTKTPESRDPPMASTEPRAASAPTAGAMACDRDSDNDDSGSDIGEFTLEQQWIWSNPDDSSSPQTVRRVVVSGAVSQSFTLLNGLATINGRVGRFLCDAKAARYDHQELGALNRPFPAVDFFETTDTGHLVYSVQRRVKVISEYADFHKYAAELQKWLDSLQPAEKFRDDSLKADDVQYFGNANHRAFVLRVRYFCLRCYAYSSMIILHSSNRRSFFAEFDVPLEVCQEAVEAGELDMDATELLLKQIMSAAFGKVWSQGLLAYDIEPESWKVCVECAHGLSEHLRRNDDMPFTRFDLILPFAVFTLTTVLLRQIRLCKSAIAKRDESQMSLSEWEAELNRSTLDVEHQWKVMQGLGTVWNVEGMSTLLKFMNVDEVAKAAEQLSSMAL